MIMIMGFMIFKQKYTRTTYFTTAIVGHMEHSNINAQSQISTTTKTEKEKMVEEK